jgi:hypothetical protein
MMPCSPLQVNRRFGEHIASVFARLATCLHIGILLGLFDPEDEGDVFLRNVA